MAKFKYELIDYDIREQNLSIEDLQYLITLNVVSPFALVRRVKELNTFPILSHPDFSEDILKVKIKSKSPSCIRFLNHLQRLRKKARGEKVNDEDTFSSQMSDRRKPLPTVIIKAPQGPILGALMVRKGMHMTILMPSMGLKIGQILEFQILASYKKERFTGKVKVFTEKVDRRNTTRLLFTYEVEQLKRPSGAVSS